MSDIVERLRKFVTGCDRPECGRMVFTPIVCEEAADEIERLRAEVQTWVNHTKTAVWSDSEECRLLAADNERLRAALREIESITMHSGGDIHGVHSSFWEVAFKQSQDTARAALGGGDE